jgi:hypothetical protein
MRLFRNLIPVVNIFSFIILILIFLLYQLNILQNDLFLAAILGVSLPLINFILGYLSIKYSINQSHSFFLIIFLGGMLFRLILMLVSVFLVFRFLENIAYSFIFIIFIFYSFYLLSEILYVNQLKSR